MAIDRMQDCEDRALCSRIIAEYLEMPGLNLTVSQACRLWNIDQPRCVRVLRRLTASGFLRLSGRFYVRVDASRHAA